MSRRLLFTLLAALLLLCVGLSGPARAAATTVAVVERAVMVMEACCARLPSDEGTPAESVFVVESGAAVELSDVPLLPARAEGLPLFDGEYLPPCPALQTGHPAPCLAGLLRPPSRRV
ncbi:hypothetical protein [Sphaerotilus sp.]|uniref:hypothetical protein n=1 Tax=Sphaerotilus sp. TaxID=2093942 RepID=UPI00286E1212|nr:hypothetical protein [Sphaerotilus sp.]